MVVSAKRRFSDLRMVGLAMERCHITDSKLVRVHFRLSQVPPLGWGFIFTNVWQGMEYPNKCRAGIDADVLWLECSIDELETCHLKELEKAVTDTNLGYREKLKSHALNSAGKARMNTRIWEKLENLNRTAFSAAAPRNRNGNSLSLGRLFSKIGQLLGLSSGHSPCRKR